jgi:hypothetical protein
MTIEFFANGSMLIASSEKVVLLDAEEATALLNRTCECEEPQPVLDARCGLCLGLLPAPEQCAKRRPSWWVEAIVWMRRLGLELRLLRRRGGT